MSKIRMLAAAVVCAAGLSLAGAAVGPAVAFADPVPGIPGPGGPGARPVGPAWMHLAGPGGLAAPVWMGVVGLTARVDPAHSGLVGPG